MICAPVNPCCCDPWHIAPGSQWPLDLYWQDVISKIPGFMGIRAIKSATLLDQTVNPPVAADPLKIKLTSGLTPEPDPPSQPGHTQILLQNMMTRNMVSVAPETPIGSVYRFDICASVRDCDGVEMILCYCVSIIVSQC